MKIDPAHPKLRALLRSLFSAALLLVLPLATGCVADDDHHDDLHEHAEEGHHHDDNVEVELEPAYPEDIEVELEADEEPPGHEKDEGLDDPDDHDDHDDHDHHDAPGEGHGHS